MRGGGVAQQDRVATGQVGGQLRGAGQQAIGLDDLADDAALQRLVGAEGLAGEQEVAAPVGAEQQRPDHLHAVAGDEPTGEVGSILEVRPRCAQHDVAEDGDLRVDVDRPIDGGDRRHLDVEQIGDEAMALADDLVPGVRRDAAGGQCRGALIRHRDEPLAGAGDHHGPHVAVGGHGAEQLSQLAVRQGAPPQRVPTRVEPDRQHPAVVPFDVRCLEPVGVLLESHPADGTAPRLVIWVRITSKLRRSAPR